MVGLGLWTQLSFFLIYLWNIRFIQYCTQYVILLWCRCWSISWHLLAFLVLIIIQLLFPEALKKFSSPWQGNRLGGLVMTKIAMLGYQCIHVNDPDLLARCKIAKGHLLVEYYGLFNWKHGSSTYFFFPDLTHPHLVELQNFLFITSMTTYLN